MTHLKSLARLMIATGLLLFPLSSFAGLTVDCNGSFVMTRPSQLIIDVLPNGVDDTVNIQCALDEATQQGIPIVSLSKGNFAISKLFVENFKGSFQGTTRADTRLSVLDDSIDCDAMIAQGMTSAAIKFSGGEPRLKFMTIVSDHPCGPAKTIWAIVHFTGMNLSDATCKNDVIFAQVDRVDMLGPNRRSESRQAAIHSSPEGMYRSGSCKMTLLGSLKVNKSKIAGYEIGVLSSMKSGAQVDINFNNFENNGIAVDLVDSNQSTTVTSNTFLSVNSDEAVSQLMAIRVNTRLNTAPDKTRLVIHKNQFMFTDLLVVSGNFHRGSVIGFKFSSKVQDVSLSVTDNRFQISGEDIFVIDIREIDNWVISGNLFSGQVQVGITTLNVLGKSISGGVIVANTFKNLNSKFADIYLSEDTTKCFVGSAQGATVRNDGSENTVL